MKNRLAIIGAGPSGLACLKQAVDTLPEWKIECFERTNSWGGSWAHMRPDFLSTSTKYTTQFADFQKFEIDLEEDPRSEFFRGSEYGNYLNSFVNHFDLASYVRLNTEVKELRGDSDDGGWEIRILEIKTRKQRLLSFDKIVFCSGLSDRIKPINSEIPQITDPSNIQDIKSKTVVVIGGGESAVDIADRLSQQSLSNEVFLSLRSGIRVSPRVHPIRNVPSDYLRNRLMLSIHENIRNSIGQIFVDFRIRFERLMRRLFPSNKEVEEKELTIQARKAIWNKRINDRAEGKLFNMFHNKSDDFLEAIAKDRIKVIGPSLNEDFKNFFNFEQTEELNLIPDLVIPSIGFESRLYELSSGRIELKDFYLGCIHSKYESLFAIGYVRPIIGNIPSIAEMQAKLVVSYISEPSNRPNDIEKRTLQQQEILRTNYPSVNTESVIPVDMFPYCDQLARELKIYPRGKKGPDLRSRLDFWLGPASTNQYLNQQFQARPSQKVFTPALANFLLLLIKMYDYLYRKFLTFPLADGENR